MKILGAKHANEDWNRNNFPYKALFYKALLLVLFSPFFPIIFDSIEVPEYRIQTIKKVISKGQEHLLETYKYAYKQRIKYYFSWVNYLSGLLFGGVIVFWLVSFFVKYVKG